MKTFSRFFLSDLQVHTPADKHQGFGDWGDRPSTEFAETFIQACVQSGVEVIAVTDHNTVSWYQCLRDEGDKQGIYVFPGVEISVNR